MKFNLLTIACASVVCTAANAATIEVPRHYASIQQAIDAAAPGDVISVDPGNYRESLEIDGKDLTLKSSSTAGGVVVDGDNRSRCMEFRNVTSATSVTGFTFANGRSPVDCAPASLPSNSNRACEVLLSIRGGGVLLRKADVQFGNCSFVSGRAFEGGGLYSWLSRPSFDACLFENLSSENHYNIASAVSINTIGRGTGTFNQCRFMDKNASAVTVYPVELQNDRLTKIMRGANEESVTFSHSDFGLGANIYSMNSNTLVESCHFVGSSSVNSVFIWASTGPYLPWPGGPHYESSYSLDYLPRSGKWSLDISDSSFYKSVWPAIYVAGRDAAFNYISIRECRGGIQAAVTDLTCESCELVDLSGTAVSAWQNSVVELNRCQIRNIAVYSSGYYSTKGGALEVKRSDLAMTDSVVENCYADEGGFLMMWEGTFKGDSNEITDCKAVNGAVVYAYESQLDSESSTYSHCTTVQPRSGLGSGYSEIQSIHCCTKCNFTSSNDTYFKLHAESFDSLDEDYVNCHRYGSAFYDGLAMSRCSAEKGDLLYVARGADMYLENSHVHHNITGTDGHVVANKSYDSELHIFDSKFAVNVVSSKPGGAGLNAVVYSDSWNNAKRLSISDTEFCGNGMTAIDAPWTDNGGVTFSRRCASP